MSILDVYISPCDGMDNQQFTLPKINLAEKEHVSWVMLDHVSFTMFYIVF